MKRIILAAVVVSVSGCAALQRTIGAASRGDVRGVASGAAELEQRNRRIQEQKARCDAIEKQQPTYEEETGIGGAVALNLAERTSGIFIEISPDLASSMPQAGVKPKPGKGPKTDLTAYVNRVGKQLAVNSARPGIDWTFVVLDSATPNAFSAPGGYVFITTGMIGIAENEAQLAAVLAHEIGHITGRHAMKAYTASKVGACVGALLAKEGLSEVRSNSSGVLSDIESLLSAGRIDVNKASADFIVQVSDGVADKLVSVGFGPDFEFEADKVAWETLVFTGYDPNEFEKLLAKLPDGGFLTPHPSNKDRIAKLAPVKAEYADFGGLKAPALDASAKAVAKK